MKLFLVHCGFYDDRVSSGLYESHTNILIVAKDFEDARAQAKALPEFKGMRMHVDGLQEIEVVQGYSIELKENPKLRGKTITHNLKYGSRSARTVES